MSEPTGPTSNQRNYSVISTRSTRKKRGFETARDMVWSMAAVAASVLVILALTWRPNPDPVREVPWQPVIAAADALTWDVISPTQNPVGWVSTSARTEVIGENKQSVFIGWVTSSEQFAALAQTNSTQDDDWLQEQTLNGAPIGEWTDGLMRPWQKLESENRRSLTTLTGQARYVITGDASWEELQQLADAVR